MLLSGDQIEIVFGDQRAVVASVGATLRSYAVGGRRVLDGFGPDEVCAGGRGQILMPWPNRIAGGQYEFAGRSEQLPIDERDLGHAIHGLVRWAEWRVELHAPDAARLGHRLAARPGYPFPLDLSVEYRLSAAGLAVHLGATNVGPGPCPFGMGSHPYLRCGERVDAIELGLPAAVLLETDARRIPARRVPVDGSAVDFRRPHAVGEARLDHAFSHLERDAQGLARVMLRHGGETVWLWLDQAFDFVQVYTGDTLADRARRRTSVAVEPMSCAPDAFHSGDGLRVLGPGESLHGRWGITAA